MRLRSCAAVCPSTAHADVGALAGQRHQAADRPEVLLAVAALAAAAPRTARRTCTPLATTGRSRSYIRSASTTSRSATAWSSTVRTSSRHTTRTPSSSAPYFDGVHLSPGAGTGRRSGRGWRRRASAARFTASRSGGGRRLGQAAVPVVLAVDAHRLEVRRQPLDLAQEVVGGEPALARACPAACSRSPPARTPASRSRVSSVETSTVSPGSSSSNSSTQTSGVRRQRLDRVVEAERPDQVGQLDEGGEQLGAGRGVPQRGQQVRLADAVAAVEVDPAGARPPGLARPSSRLRGRSPTRRRRTPGARSTASRLGRLPRVGTVGVEADVGEPRRRHQLGDQPVRGHPGVALGEVDRHRVTLRCSGWISL